ncbi:MAG: response regulator, partial [Pelovirga sp.]
SEDDEMVQKILQRCLMACGWQVEIAASGFECIKKWRTGNFGLILMDLQMPEMDGLETTRQIRREESGSKDSVKIIGLTAWAEKKTRELCREVGMDYFLTKPVSFHDLQEAVIRCLSS